MNHMRSHINYRLITHKIMINRFNLSKLLNKNVLKFIQINPALYTEIKKRTIDLTLTENPLGSPFMVKRLLGQLPIDVSSYPKGLEDLKILIAEKFNFPKDSVLLGNGSESLIDLVSRVFINQNDEVIIPETTTIIFKRAVLISGGKPVLIKMNNDKTTNLSQVKKVLKTKPKMAFIANPNNPTGELISKEAIFEIVKNFSQIIFVIDEANIEFSDEKNSLIREAPKLDNLIVLRSFSKGFGLAGLRLGFLVANQKLAEILAKVNQVFAVNSVALLAAKVALADKEFLRRTKKFSQRQRKFLVCELIQLGFKVTPSESNNLLVKIPKKIKPEAFLCELISAGVSIIPGSYFDGLDDSYFRVNIQSNKVNKKFIKIIRRIK